MKSFLSLLFFLAGVWVFADPMVDGKVGPGEYSHELKLLDGKVLLSYQKDSMGDLWLAVQAKAKGYVGVGIGSKKMKGATIFLGLRGTSGDLSYSEETGAGHHHSTSQNPIADQHAVGDQQGWLTVEVHIPANKVVLDGTALSYIVAYSDSTDPTSWHGFFNKASGTVDLSKE
jgi:hypothetical protein